MNNRHIVLVAHNIRSLWNIGSLFRTSDCFAVEKLYLTGYTAQPPRREICKTALGAEEWISWQYISDPLEAVEDLREKGWHIVALEQSEASKDVSAYRPPSKIALIVGHEVSGLPREVLDACDDVVHMPMFGKKKSLNVSVAAGIALHHLRNTP